MVPGGGAVETALCEYLECFAITLGSREQLAIAEFAESLTVIPKVFLVSWFLLHFSLLLLTLVHNGIYSGFALV